MYVFEMFVFQHLNAEIRRDDMNVTVMMILRRITMEMFESL